MTAAASAYLIDTNLLIYAYDARDPAKQQRAIEVLEALQGSGLGALSVQVLGEFYVNVTRKPEQPLTPAEARLSAIRLSRSWPVLDVTPRAYLDAVRAVDQHRLSYWDALVWGTARDYGLPYILSEDQQHGRLVEDVRYFDPFRPDFDLARLS